MIGNDETRGRGILAIWHDFVPESGPEILDWYDREHHAERLAIPGFLSVRRYRAVEAATALFIRYETLSPAVLESPAYLARVNAPTPWTLRSQPDFRNNSRTVCVRHGSAPVVQGGFALTCRLRSSSPLDASTLPGWSEWRARIEAERFVLGVEHWVGDPSRSSLPSREKEIRQVRDEHVGGVIVVHASDVAPLKALMAASDWPHQGGTETTKGIYGLSFEAYSRHMN